MSWSDTQDDLIAYGTPVEPLEEDEIPLKKPRLLEDQVVKDKQGRRRFHGAFTGGFSAGFFNTVGSLEGWTPSSFKSSKSKKQEIFQQKPEDFMDEEDISEFGIAPVVLKARQDFTTETQTFSEFLTLGTYVLQDILRPVRETIGIKLLKKMGWKPGQGVGRRLNKNEKKRHLEIRRKTYGCQLPPGALENRETDSNSDSDSEWDDIQFAPSDCEPLLCEARNNFCGIGYEGLDKRPILSGNPYIKQEDSTRKKNKQVGVSSQAFGVGALEEEDEDIYARDDMSNYNFFLGKEESVDSNKLADKISPPPDGALEGFSLETKTRPIKNYPLPTIPRDLKTHHRFRHSRFDPPSTNNNIKTMKGLKGSYEDRRKLLDESRGQFLDIKNNLLTKKLICNVKIAESQFKPFSVIPEKQERYENYLKLVKIGKKELLGDLQPFSMTSWDKEREKIEFEKAALLFRPLTGEMEDRFSVASQPDDLTDPLAVVQKYEENDDRKRAAKMNMFGPITRKTEDWLPSTLLCKRFNIPQPENSHSRGVEKQKGKPHFNLFDSVQNLNEHVDKAEESEELFHEELPTQEPVTGNQNITDLYKAIFLDSDDEEKSCDRVSERQEINEEQNLNKISEKKTTEDDLLYEDKLINSQRNLSPPKGIFKNIDLDLLSGREEWKGSMPEESKKNKLLECKDTAETSIPPLDLVYGPRIPEKIVAKTDSFSSEILQDAGVWIEKKNRNEKKHKKKEKKSKKASHKSKHKHKHKR